MYTMHQETYWIFTLSTGQSINNLGFFIILNWIYGLLITFSSFTQGQTTVRSPNARIYGTFLPGHRIRPIWVNSNLSQYCKQSYNTVQAKTEMLVYQGFILTASYLFFRSSSLHHHEFKSSCPFLSVAFWQTGDSARYLCGNRWQNSPAEQSSCTLSRSFGFLLDKPFIIAIIVRFSFMHCLSVSPERRWMNGLWNNQTMNIRKDERS